MDCSRKAITKFPLLILGACLFFISLNSHAGIKAGDLSGTILVQQQPCFSIFGRRFCLPVFYTRDLPVNMTLGNNNAMTVSFGASFDRAPYGLVNIYDNGIPVDASISIASNSVKFASNSSNGFSDIDYHDVAIRPGIRFRSGSWNLITVENVNWRIRSLKCYLAPNNTDDTDKDGLMDCEEQPGVAVGSDPQNQSLALYDWGARINKKDVFIEVDYMDDEVGRVDPYLKPTRDALQKVVDAYAQRDVHVHFDVGDLLDQSPGINPANFDLGGGNMLPFSEPSDYSSALNSRVANMDTTREDYFYYMLYASSQLVGQPGSSGWGSYDLTQPSNTTLITLGRWTSFNSTVISNYQAGTMMHELGHNFGLHHGGVEDLNLKPNYISVMNYLYQLLGIPYDGAALNQRYGFGWWNSSSWPSGCQFGTLDGLTNGPMDPNMLIDYSDGVHASMPEATLTEQAGVDIANPIPMDFNCDGSTNSPNIGGIDVNHDGLISVLNDYNDWNIDNWMMYFYYMKNPTFSILSQSVSKPVEELTPPPSFFEALAKIK